MNRSILFSTVSFLLVTGAASAFAASAPSSQTAMPAGPSQPGSIQAAPETPATVEFQFGPIQSKDPEVRAQIKKLYLDQAELERTTASRLDELQIALAAESDGDLRLALQKEMIAAKRGLQLETMQLGLQIAQLNGDESRADEFERAIELFLHPEKTMPATLDPSIAAERARSLGQE